MAHDQFNKKPIIATLCATVFILGLSSCAGKKEVMPLTTSATPLAITTSTSGHIKQSIETLQKKFKSGKYTADEAVSFVHLLRRDGQAQESLRVANIALKRKDADARLITEMAAAHIALGQFETAEDKAGKILSQPELKTLHPEAAHLMGIAVDAQGRHKDAEIFLRQALDGWTNDPAPVMNNLGLNLASQAKFDEALNTLRRALLLSPERAEIAENITIVSALRNKFVPTAPTKIVY